jgi:hypothetical protein
LLVGRWRVAFWGCFGGAWAREDWVVVVLLWSRRVEVTIQGIVWSCVRSLVVIAALISMLLMFRLRNLER